MNVRVATARAGPSSRRHFSAAPVGRKGRGSVTWLRDYSSTGHVTYAGSAPPERPEIVGPKQAATSALLRTREKSRLMRNGWFVRSTESNVRTAWDGIAVDAEAPTGIHSNSLLSFVVFKI